ncbi:MAG: response regulator [Oligoflexia bacterium]|nr:response regulator [Oligoflexia bacterium]
MSIILLVEDTQLQAKKTVFLLNKLGHKVIHSLNGKIALEDLQKEENRNIEIVITDMQMPEMDGLQLVKKIKEHPDKRIKNTPIIVMTSFGTEESCNDSITLGADDFINKPFRAEEVTLRINSVLDKKKTEELARMQMEAIESSVDGMAILNQNATYLFANKAQLSLLGYKSLSEVLNVDWKSHFHQELNKQIESVWEDVWKYGKWSGEQYLTHVDGKVIPIETSITKITNDLYVAVSRDITQRKNTEQLINMMIDSLGQGLVVFDSSGKCLPNYTKATIDLMKCQPDGKFLWELISVDEKESENIKKWIKALFELKIPFKDICKLGPSSVKKYDRRFISLEYYPMFDLSKKLISVVMVATDRTQEQQAKLEAQKNLDYASMIINLIKNKKQFVIFLKDARKMIIELEDLLEKAESDINYFNIKKIKILLHSLKGGCGVYSLTDLQVILHNYEAELDEVAGVTAGTEVNSNDKKYLSYLPRMKQNIVTINNLFNKRISSFHSFLGDAIVDGQHRTEINISELKNYTKKLSKVLGEKNPLLETLVDQFVKIPIIHLFQAYDNLVSKQAQKRNKNVDPIIFQGNEIKVDADNYTKLSTVLEHAFMNIVDHGLETSEERERLGKPINGRIMVSFTIQKYQNNNTLKITIQDDGRGIDPQKIREKLLKIGMSKDKIENDDNTVIQHIFDESFSLSEGVSITSGRGIGMSAIKSVVEEMGGAVVVNSVYKKGTRLVIVVPFV